ncbi:MAG: hypothetical protein EBT30_07555 [Verrucomicrobia bacterium]|nr:hypothetical protein [Verrucomicrobiota bacterium]
MLRHPRAYFCKDRRLPRQASHGNTSFGDCPHRQVIVTVDEPGETQTFLQIDHFGLGSCCGTGLRLGSYHFNPVPSDDQRLGPGLFWVHGKN